ncbi:uncharacterized protein [Branchiostoma lanceolatum]|uniref:uncharacterized protein n=1 Tax=Branchiostoma lanceolatum TaxID=7740 RepID=UPI0034543C2C
MKRTVSSSEYRCRFLEQENSQLQERLDALNRQKDRLDRLVRDYRIEKQREAITRSLTSIPQSIDSEFVSARPSSGLGTSLSSHILDGQPDLGTPYHHSSPILNSYLSQMNYSPGTEEDLDNSTY